MLRLKRSRLLTGLIALAILAGLFFAFFHHHEDGQNHEDCAVCRLITLFSAIVLFAALIFALPSSAPANWFPYKENRTPFQGVSTLLGRAPPVFSSL